MSSRIQRKRGRPAHTEVALFLAEVGRILQEHKLTSDPFIIERVVFQLINRFGGNKLPQMVEFLEMKRNQAVIARWEDGYDLPYICAKYDMTTNEVRAVLGSERLRQRSARRLSKVLEEKSTSVGVIK